MDPAKKEACPPQPSWQDAAFEFELTDFAEARRVLDGESLSQFDVATAASPAQWKRLRRAPLPTDRALSGQAIDWLLSLPPGLRPQALAARFPRIVHALSQVWNDPEACLAELDKLLDCQRKGRTGFAPEVRNELTALRAWMHGRRGWDRPF